MSKIEIIVKAKAGAKVEKVELLTQPTLGFGGGATDLDVYKVWVKEPAENGKANRAITKALAEHFQVSVSCIKLLSGSTAKTKRFSIIV